MTASMQMLEKWLHHTILKETLCIWDSPLVLTVVRHTALPDSATFSHRVSHNFTALPRAFNSDTVPANRHFCFRSTAKASSGSDVQIACFQLMTVNVEIELRCSNKSQIVEQLSIPQNKGHYKQRLVCRRFIFPMQVISIRTLTTKDYKKHCNNRVKITVVGPLQNRVAE